MDYAIIKELESKYSLKNNPRRTTYTHGQENKLFDINGREYVDFASGDENCLGYSYPPLKMSLAEQAARLVNSPFSHDRYALALDGLVDKNAAFFRAAITNSAAEANALAMDVAKSFYAENGTNKEKIVVVRDGSLNNFTLLKDKLDENTAALVIEPVTEGVQPAQYDYLVNAYALAKAMDVLFVCDETRIGQGRLGRRFAYEIYGIQPDIVTISRGMAAGVAAGGVLIKGTLSYKNEVDFMPASALACAAVGVVNDFLSLAKMEEIAQAGDYLMGKLVKLSKHNFVLNVRGKGLLAAVELSGRIVGAKVVSQMEKAGYLIGLTEGNVLRFCPPLTISREEIDMMIGALSNIFAATNI